MEQICRGAAVRDSTGFENEVAVRSSLRIAPVLTCPVSHGRARKKALAAARRPLNCPKIKVNEKRERGPCGCGLVWHGADPLQMLQETAF